MKWIFRNFVLLFCLIFIYGCSFVASRIIPVKDIKTPTGEYTIGTKTYNWTDIERDEWFSEEEGDKRELVVQVWYPSIEVGNEKSPWQDYPFKRVKSIANSFQVPKFIAYALDRVGTSSYINSTPISNETFPIIIFSHGFEGFKTQNTTQIEELVSHGYIVFAVDHTYDATLTIFPDGRKIERAKKYCPDCEGDSLKFFNVFKPQIETRIFDIIFVINQIEKDKDDFSFNMDLDKIGVFGHSFGGGTSLGASILDSRIKSCLSLDGWYTPIHPDIYNLGLSIPFLHLGRPEWETKHNYETLDYILDNKTSASSYKISLVGSHHYDFTDSPHLSDLSSKFQLSSKLESKEILYVTNTSVLGFFDKAEWALSWSKPWPSRSFNKRGFSG